MNRWRLSACFVALALLAACAGGGGEPLATSTPASTRTATPPPTTEPAGTPAPAPEIDLPEGFSAHVVAKGLRNPAAIALSPEGAVFVAQTVGSIVRLADADGDGFFESRGVVASANQPNGLAFSPQGELYVSSRGRVSILRDPDGDGAYDAARDIITGLPNGRHQNNGITFGPDGKLYVTNGSTCNECDEDDERSATILQANADGSDLRVYARGLRNSYDLVFDPQGRLWATDNGSDPPCNTIDELNLIEDGGDYGWPYSPSCDSFQSGIAPVADLGFNTASTGIDYYDGVQLPPPYRDGFFITLYGSLGFAPEPAGRTLVWVTVSESAGGLEATVEDFGTGFVRPIDVVMDRDGTLLVADWGTGRIYRIAYAGA